MLQKLKLLILSFSSLIMFSVPLLATGTAHAVFNQQDINSSVCGGTNGDLTGATQTNCTNASGTANNLVRTVVNVLSVIVGAVAVIMIIFAGFRYITSGGKQESVTSAKNTILYAVIGLVIVALAQLIVHYVLNKTNDAQTGVNT